jgi:hypothetical protein
MVSRLLVAALFALLLAPAASAAEAAWKREANGARAALARSVKADLVTPADAQRYRGILSHARVVHRRVPPLRKRILEGVLAQVAEPKSPTGPRALQLYTTLQENTDYLLEHRVPASGTDVTGADGAVYRVFYGQGLQFHPLANAARLNALYAAGETEATQELVDALVARGVPRRNGALAWEYWFDYGSQQAPWTSGMAQAVMAQALARTGSLDHARRAYRSIPGELARDLPAGPWIRLYSGNSLVVLNAQLQSAISIGDYAELAKDAGAAAFSNGLLAAAKTMLPRFDTGHWSRYSLEVPSDLGYHDFVIGLLKRLATRSNDPVWAETAQRFAHYETEPPRMTGTSATRVLYPRPIDGVADTLVVRFFLSKISKVVLVVDGTAVDGDTWTGGVHTFSWPARDYGVGEHRIRLVARSLDGNSGETDVGSFTVLRDATPPVLAAAKSNGSVFWHVKDGESACCRLRLHLHRQKGDRVIPLQGARGRASVPPGYWSVTVVATDAAGNRAERKLGLVVGRPT